ncbi:MAG: GTPase Era [Gammaproteobacteria bacterium]|nr:GTPase Era [Gammaproteobacteria bacterium]MCZ6911991.1 GTPase Era [Pseudomonadota bacterium]
MAEEFRCGFVALVGRPNVGKSTLLNRLVGQKISIVTPKAQTTRHRILGIVTRSDFQLILVDTPGLHRSDASYLNRLMNQAAIAGLDDADLVLFMTEALRWNERDQRVLEILKSRDRDIVLVINKIDQIRDKQELLPFIETLSKKADFVAIVPVSARKSIGLDGLSAEILPRLPISPALFDSEQLTDRSREFRAAEIIREKLMLMLQEEVPYGTTVQIERFEKGGKGYVISALVWVARAGQKKIVIGSKGSMMKKIGEAARRDLKRFVGEPVHLELWVKVKEKWADNEMVVKSMGYEL